MARDGTPIDLAFPTWVGYPGSPSKPGASDFNRLQFDVDFLANPPSARLSRTIPTFVNSSLAFSSMFWDVNAWESDPAMIAGGVDNGGAFTSGISLPYPGQWLARVVVRSQFNNTSGNSQIQLMRSVSSTSDEVLIDQDIKPCASAYPNVMRIDTEFLITQAMVDDDVNVRVEYSQNSGGQAQIMASSQLFSGIFAYPSFMVRWVGTGNL